MSHPNQRAADELRDHLDALLALETERDELKKRKSERLAEIKARGYDPKALLAVLQRVREDEADRCKRESVAASAEIYAATLGIDLGGFGARSDPGLSPGARDAIERSRRPGPPDPGSPDVDDDAPHGAAAQLPETMAGTPLAPSPGEIEAARQQGADAFHAGVDVLANPYLAGDPRRFVWDNGWCAAGGTDGMDIPAHLRRPADRRRPKPDPDAPAPAATPTGSAESATETKAGPPPTPDEPNPDEEDA